MRGFYKVLLRLSTITGTNYSMNPTKVRSVLTKIFQLYETKFLRAQHQPSNAAKGKNKKT